MDAIKKHKMNNPQYPVSIKGVISIMAKYLLLKNDRNEWEPPGGRIELGETPEECVQREIFEEVGIAVQVGPIINSYLFEVISGKYVFIVTYMCNHSYEEITDTAISNEHLEIGFFSMEEIVLMNLPEGYKETIRACAKI